MATKTAVMFAGVDALDLASQRAQVINYPEVLARLLQAQELVNSIAPASQNPSSPISSGLNLVDFIASADPVFHGNLPLKALVCAVSQVGLFDRYLKENDFPDYLVGCSLGDTARTVCSGAATFEEMIRGTYVFNSVGQTIQGGAIVCARTGAAALSANEVAAIEAEGLTVAVHQTPRHFLVSGPADILREWVATEAKALGYSIRPLYDKPLHSIGMSAALEAVKSGFGETRLRTWRGGLVSSVNQSVITNEAELRADIEANMISTVYWWQTFRWMVEHLGIERFVNVGPVTTLMLFADRIPLHKAVLIEDSLAVREMEAPALSSAP